MNNQPVIIHSEYDRQTDRAERSGDELFDFFQRVLRYLYRKYHTYPEVLPYIPMTEQQELEMRSYEQLANICAETGLGQ